MAEVGGFQYFFSMAIQTESILYGGAERLSGYLAVPEGTGPFPGLVVIHEWWGLNDQIKAAAADLAKAGYAALAVDLYRGTVTAKFDEAQKAMMSLDGKKALSDLREAYAFLSGRPYVRKGNVASIGWCMGGGYSLQLACNEPGLSACVIYYGRLETDPAALARIGGPVLGFFGADDTSIPVDAVRGFESAMGKAGRSVSVYIYPGAGHAFANPTRTDAYRPEATKDSWQRMISFLGKELM
jgi:carboxymethylenebutenolidase